MLTISKFKTAIILIASLLLSACDDNSTTSERKKISHYPVQLMSGFNIHYPTSFSMSRKDTEHYFQILPDYVQDVTTEMLVYKSEPICNLAEVRLVYFKMNKIMTYDIDSGAQGIVDNIALLDGMKEIFTSIKPLDISGFQGRHVLFEGKMAQENVSYEGVLISDTKNNRVWQLQFIGDVNSQSNRNKYRQQLECTSGYIASITIEK
ncbi:hypothetical protein [Proteus hauseri]|uniref:hypothetical protein n=1 Tax=Proteus hauseri TaxID=183417 RepID=UPI0032DB9CB6